MDYELTLYQLGNFLENILEKYKMTLTIKVKLSGGWITLRSNVKIDSLPKEEGLTAGNNVISLKLDNVGEDLKITGLKNLKFKVNLSPAKYKEINKKGLSIDMVKEKNDKSTLRIDDNMIFSINAPINEINKLI